MTHSTIDPIATIGRPRTIQPPARPLAAKPEPWTSVCRINEIRPGRARAVVVNGVEIVVCRDLTDSDVEAETVYAVSGRCPHRDAPLANGAVQQGHLTCPLHGCEFELRSGISPNDPTLSITVFEARLRGDIIQVLVDIRGPALPEVYLGRWARRRNVEPDVAYVHAIVEGKQPTQPTTSNTQPTLDDLVFIPAGLSRPSLTAEMPIDTTTIIGKRAQKPLKLTTPVYIGHISLGAVSIEAKVALARGSRSAGTAIGSGDGGSNGRERDAANAYIVQILPGQRPEPSAVIDADAMELRISEGGRPGRPAWLPGVKVTTEIGLQREIAPRIDYAGPSATGPDQLAADIAYLRSISNGLPIGIKLAAGAIEADLAIAVKSDVDYVTFDAHTAAPSGNDGAALAAHAGLPILATITRARRYLDAHSPQVQLVVSGGFYRGDDIAKALALGADAVAIGSAALLAIGCQRYQACDNGSCPVGIATQNPSLRLRLNPDISARRLATYLANLTTTIADYCRLTARPRSAQLSREDLAARDERAAAITGLPTVFDTGH